MSERPLLSVDHLRVEYPVRNRLPFRAVDDVTFAIGPRETVGLVGESGSGKTTIANAVLGFAPCHRWREFAALPSRDQARPAPAADCDSSQATGRMG